MPKGSSPTTSFVTLSLLKQAPKAPRNFRPKQSLVAAGDNVVLRWEGSDTFKYQIYGPGGLSKAKPKRVGTGWTWSPATGEEPKRDATYTLTATSKPRQQPPEHTLTTTVNLRDLEFESVTATNGLHTPWVEGTTAKGRITFTSQGARINNDSGTSGTISANKADIDSVLTATSVRGHGNDAGWIEFPATGIKVGHGTGTDLGTVTADKADLNGINTAWVQGRNASDGWIAFLQTGVQVYKDGKREWGTVDADKADLNGVVTKWVQGRGDSAGWIAFPATGLNVFQGAGSRQWGTVAADKAGLNDLVTHRALVRERLTLQGGLTVDNVLETQNGPPRLVVHGRLDAEGEVNAAGNVTVNGDLRPMRNLEVRGAVRAGDLTVRGKLTTEDNQFKLIVHGESQFEGKVNANGRPSVRNGTDGLMHVNDDQVAIQGNLRVHGAFRSDS